MSDSHSRDVNLPKKKWFQRLRDLFDADPQNREEVIDILRDAAGDGVLDRDTLNMLESVMGVADLRVRDIMVPSAQMTVIDLDSALNSIVKTVIESGHSRYPVIDGSRDDVVGILLAKDLLSFSDLAAGDPEKFDLHEHLRKAVVVPESKRCDALLREFRANRNHMAIVVDEYGSVSGLVTIEDVLEQIVGDIADEYDFDESDDAVRAVGVNEWRVRADAEIAAFNLAVGAEFSDAEFDTIGGVVTQAFGHMPQTGEMVTLAPFEFSVISADSRRLKLLRVKRS
jgi:magnesium and cobalt transporter